MAASKVLHERVASDNHACGAVRLEPTHRSEPGRNVEFGLRIHDPALAESVETTMTTKHGTLYELA